MKPAYYNENDPFAAEWLRHLMMGGHIAPGYVDERSIEDVCPADLEGYAQHHFFAGIGVWSYALRHAGWPDDRPIWTASCPCQPFSASGKRGGFADERHLWPALYWLIKQCRPPIVLGEQVASKAAEPWFDLVQADLEAMGYAFGCVPFPSAGVGAPHIRDRAYWVAYGSSTGLQERVGDRRVQSETMVASEGQTANGGSDSGGLAYASSGRGSKERQQCSGEHGFQSENRGSMRAGHYGARPESSRLADNRSSGRGKERQDGGRVDAGDRAQGRAAGPEPRRYACRVGDAKRQQPGRDAGASIEAQRGEAVRAERDGPKPSSADGRGPGPTDGFWRAADWLHCRDGKWRPVEPGSFPLANGAAARVGRLRGYGNAINAEAAKVFVEEVAAMLAFPVTVR